MARLVNALGIPHVGKETAFLLAQQFGSIDYLSEATVERLVEIEGIGPKVAESIVGFFATLETQNLISDLRDLDVSLAEERAVSQTVADANHPYYGKTFVLTGTLPTLTRDEAEAKIREAGGKLSSSVSKKTDFVLLGDNPGSKYDKAIQLNIAILDEAAFLAAF